MTAADSLRLKLSGLENIYFTHTTTSSRAGSGGMSRRGGGGHSTTTTHTNEESNQIIDLAFELAMTPEIG